jgi:hypothetical protein
MKIKCDCIDKDTKDQINNSNLPPNIKNIFSNLRTCGHISEKKVLEIIDDCKSRPIKCVIDEMKKFGLTKSEIDEKVLNMREKGMIELEVGTPIGIETIEQLKDVTISTEKNRFNYAKRNFHYYGTIEKE